MYENEEIARRNPEETLRELERNEDEMWNMDDLLYTWWELTWSLTGPWEKAIDSSIVTVTQRHSIVARCDKLFSNQLPRP